MVSRSPGYASVGSRRYNAWQTLAYEATTDQTEEGPEEYISSFVEHSPKVILSCSKEGTKEKIDTLNRNERVDGQVGESQRPDG